MTMNEGRMAVDSPIIFGEVYEDTITGFKGKAIGITRWITGCDQIALASGITINKDSGKQENSVTHWFDDGRLVLVATKVRQPSSGNGAAGDPPSDRVTG